MKFRTLDTSRVPFLIATAALLAIACVPSAGAQVASERYAPQEFVARLLAQGPGDTVRYSAATTFSECPHESPWHDQVFQALRDRLEVRSTLGMVVARARHRCDDPRLDQWFLQYLRETSEPGGDPSTITLWSTALRNYPVEILRRPEFQALFWERASDEGIAEFVRGAAVSALFRERSEAEETQILIRMRAEGIGLVGVAMRQAVLRSQWTEGYITALAEVFESKPDWRVMRALMWDAPSRAHPNVSPAVRERFLAALRDAADDPRDDWPEEAVAELLRVLRWVEGPPPGI
jgi:hypothetical protein